MLELLLLCFAPGFSLVVPARRLAPVRCGILGAATLDVETLDASGGGVIKTAEASARLKPRGGVAREKSKFQMPRGQIMGVGDIFSDKKKKSRLCVWEPKTRRVLHTRKEKRTLFRDSFSREHVPPAHRLSLLLRGARTGSARAGQRESIWNSVNSFRSSVQMTRARDFPEH